MIRNHSGKGLQPLTLLTPGFQQPRLLATESGLGACDSLFHIQPQENKTRRMILELKEQGVMVLN